LRQCGKHPPVTVSPAYQDWVTKGAHLHVGGEEVRIFPDDKGGYGGQPLRRRGGMATRRDVEAAFCALSEDDQLRERLIANAESAMNEMNARHWASAQNRAAEMKFLIEALRR
jgi:hypothetical protein